MDVCHTFIFANCGASVSIRDNFPYNVSVFRKRLHYEEKLCSDYIRCGKAGRRGLQAAKVYGQRFGHVGYLIKEGKFDPTFSEFIGLAKAMLEKPKLLNETIMFSLIGLVPYLFITWSANRKHLKQFFQPKIEVIPTFPLKR